MSTTGRPAPSTPAASDVAARLREADFVRLVGHASADGLAATGQLGRALAATAVPFQAGVGPFGDDRGRGTDADVTVAVGRPDVDATLALGTDAAASATAFEVAATLGGAAPALAGAGLRATGAVPEGSLAEALDAAEFDRRPGLAVPTADLADGLAHTTLVHGPYSGDPDAAAALLADPDAAADAGPDGRRAASLTALATVGRDAPKRAGTAVSSVLHPFDGGPLETLGGFGDVLRAAAEARPGQGLAVALGRADPTSVLPDWRDHGRRAHAAVADATTTRHDGLLVARCSADAPLGTVARLLLDYRTPEPVVLAMAAETAVARTAADDVAVADAARQAATPVDGRAAGTATRARATVQDTDAFADAFREALP